VAVIDEILEEQGLGQEEREGGAEMMRRKAEDMGRKAVDDQVDDVPLSDSEVEHSQRSLVRLRYRELAGHEVVVEGMEVEGEIVAPASPVQVDYEVNVNVPAYS